MKNLLPEEYNGTLEYGNFGLIQSLVYQTAYRQGIGDLIVANRPGFLWSEKLNPDGEVFEPALSAGYKQGILAEHQPGMWTPLIIMGPGVRKNYEFSKPVRHVDQYPTIMSLLDKPVPDFVQGEVLSEILEGKAKE